MADGVWVRQSAWVWSNAIAVRGEGGSVLVDPGIDGSDLNQLADDLDRLGLPVVAGFSTHPHWDHRLWHSRFGDATRYVTSAGAHTASEAREPAQTMPAESASGVPLELIGLVTPLPADGGPGMRAHRHDRTAVLRDGVEGAGSGGAPCGALTAVHTRGATWFSTLERRFCHSLDGAA